MTAHNQQELPPQSQNRQLGRVCMESERVEDDDPELPSPVVAPSKPHLLNILGPPHYWRL